MKKFGAPLVAFIKAFGAREVFMVFGLSVLGVGIAMLHVPTALITVGTIMVAVAIFGVRPAPRAKPVAPPVGEAPRFRLVN